MASVEIRKVDKFFGSTHILHGVEIDIADGEFFSMLGPSGSGKSSLLDAIAAVIQGGTSFVGGIGSIWGTLIGALIIAVLSNGLILLGVSDIWQFIIKGLVIIGAVGLDRLRLQGGART